MIAHIIFILLILMTNFKSKLSKKTTLQVSFVILFLFAALRYKYGNDYSSYSRHYSFIQNGFGTVFKNEIAFEWLNKISPNYVTMLAAISAFYLFAVYKLIVYAVEERNVGLSVIILLINPYLFVMSLSAIRQSIAIGIFIFAVYFAYKRKPHIYIILILIAALFHTSAIILLPFYFIANDWKINKIVIIVYCALLLIWLLSERLFAGSMEYVLGKLDNHEYNFFYNEGGGNSVRATILSAIPFIYIVIHISKLEGTTLLCAKLYVIALTFAILAFNVSMMTRLQQYFDIFSVVAIPNIIMGNYRSETVRKNKFMYVLNVLLFPALIFAIYILRYYSFFTNPMWESFWTYRTILGV